MTAWVLGALAAVGCTKLADAGRRSAGERDAQQVDDAQVSEGPGLAGLADGAVDAATPLGDDAALNHDGATADGGTSTGPQIDEGGAPVDAGGFMATSCTDAGALRCAAGAARDVCRNGMWAPGDPCPRDTVCTMDDPARCPSLLAACAGNLGKSVCTGSIMQHCDDKGLSSGSETCKSERLCQTGLAKGHCATCNAGEFRCTGAALEKCSDDGEQWVLTQTCSSAALCNDSAGACTSATCTTGQKRCNGDLLERCNATGTGFEPDTMCPAGLCDPVGKECDVCLPSSRSCLTATTYQVCQASGQSYSPMPCASATPWCTGNVGACVACTKDADCKDPGECKSAVCSAGACVPSSDGQGATCKLSNGSTGLCDGFGSCLACLTQGDACTMSNGSAGVCNNAHTCVGCNTPSDCHNSINSCQVRTCTGNVCGARANTGANCTSGASNAFFCNAQAQCVQCLKTSDCNSVTLECNSNFMCSQRCGNGIIERDNQEECDPAKAGYNTSNCVICKQTIYTPSAGNCPEPLDSNNLFAPAGCPSIPGYTATCLGLFGQGCYLACNSDSDCPIRYKCSSFAGTPYATFNPPFVGYCK